MNAQPAPFTPADCDLRGYEWMPLFGARLFASNFEAHASDLAFRIAIKLYWECWQQVPAASLPNDDVQLCRLAGLGRDLKTWRKLRADGVLHGFVLCADDRLYHGLIAEAALKAWKCRQREDRAREQTASRTRHWRERNTNGRCEDVTRHRGNGDASRDDGIGEGPASRDASRASFLDSTGKYRKEPTPLTPHGGEGTPAAPGTPPDGRRINGTNPREKATNPRATGRREGFVSGGIAVLADRLLQRATSRQDEDRTNGVSCLQIMEGGRG